MNDTSISVALLDLFAEIVASIEEHGDWQNYDGGDVCKAVCDEHREYLDAVDAGDIDGKHGQIRELRQLACVSIKGVIRLEQTTRKEQGHGNE